MSMTDPIADFLTRIRNGIMAAHETVEIPSSRLKREMARILTEQGYIEGYDEAPGVPGSAADKILVRLKYTENRTSVISGLSRVSRPGQRTLRGRQAHPEGPGRHGHDDPVHLARRHDRPRGPRRRASAARSWPRSGSQQCPASVRSPSPSPRPSP